MLSTKETIAVVMIISVVVAILVFIYFKYSKDTFDYLKNKPKAEVPVFTHCGSGGLWYDLNKTGKFDCYCRYVGDMLNEWRCAVPGHPVSEQFLKYDQSKAGNGTTAPIRQVPPGLDEGTMGGFYDLDKTGKFDYYCRMVDPGIQNKYPSCFNLRDVFKPNFNQYANAPANFDFNEPHMPKCQY